MIQNRSVFYFLAILFTILIGGCESSDKGNSDLKRNVTAFVSDSNQVVGFGYVDVKKLKNKSEISKIPELKEFLENTFHPIEKVVQLEDKVFYAFAGPVQDNGPEISYAFLNIRNKDSLQDGLELLGFYFKESSVLPGVKLYDDENTAIGFNDHTLILISASFDHDPRMLLLDAFQSFESPTINKDVMSALSSQNDILLATFIDELFEQSSFLKKKVPKENQDNFKELLQDGIWTLGVQFNKGNLITELNISNVDDQLKQLYFLQQDNNEIPENLGSDTANFALLLHLDMERLDSLLNYFGEQQIKNFYNSLSLPVIAKGLIASEGLSGLTNGNICFVIGDEINEEALLGLGMYTMNFNIGLGKKSQNIIDLIDTLAGTDQISELGDGFYQLQNKGILRLKDNSLLYQSNTFSKDNFKTGSIKIKSQDSHFGKLPISMYINLENKLVISSPLPEPVRNLFDYAVLQGNNDVFTLKILMKNKRENVLKQLLDGYKNEIINRIQSTPAYN